MSPTTDIEQRLRGENPEKCVVTDRLRANIGMPDTFQFDRDDAVELDELILEAADEIARLEADNAYLHSKLEEAEGAQGWQPIETAPKDGSRFIGLWEGLVYTIRWQLYYDKWPHQEGGPTYKGGWSAEVWDQSMPCRPTHWVREPTLASLREADHA